MFIFLQLFIGVSVFVHAQQFISDKPQANSFSFTDAAVYTDVNDYTTVQAAASLLRQDMKMVTGKEPQLVSQPTAASKTIIIIGSLDKSSLIKQLVEKKQINITAIKGKSEAYQLQTISNPFKGVDNAIVIAGNDRRGTAFGVFELSKQIGVSPWYWSRQI